MCGASSFDVLLLSTSKYTKITNIKSTCTFLFESFAFLDVRIAPVLFISALNDLDVQILLLCI